MNMQIKEFKLIAPKPTEEEMKENKNRTKELIKSFEAFAKKYPEEARRMIANA